MEDVPIGEVVSNRPSFRDSMGTDRWLKEQKDRSGL
jgi:hypothetical protein